jgi:hypothetical protein
MYLALMLAYVAVIKYMAEKPGHVLDTRTDVPAAVVAEVVQ